LSNAPTPRADDLVTGNRKHFPAAWKGTNGEGLELPGDAATGHFGAQSGDLPEAVQDLFAAQFQPAHGNHKNPAAAACLSILFLPLWRSCLFSTSFSQFENGAPPSANSRGPGIMCQSVRPVERAMRELGTDPQSTAFPEQPCRP
jgi:hypothetical protein